MRSGSSRPRWHARRIFDQLITTAIDTEIHQEHFLMDHSIDGRYDAFGTADHFSHLVAINHIGVNNFSARQQSVPTRAARNDSGDGGTVTGAR